MACPGCCGAAVAGGWIGSYIGITPPGSKYGKIFCAVISTALTVVTVIMLKVFAGFSLCGGQPIISLNLAILFGKTLVIGVGFSIAVNLLYNCFITSNKQQTDSIID